MKTKQKHSAVPIWIAAGCWAVWALLFPLYRLFHIILCAGFGMLMWLIFDSCIKGETVTVPDPPAEPQSDLERFRLDCRKAREEFTRLSRVITNAEISRCCERLAQLTGQISERMTKVPEKLTAFRQFNNYILPATVNIMDTYARMGAEGIAGKNIDGTMLSVENAAPALQSAFERRLDALYSDEAVDIELDLTVIENLTKQGKGQ